jgi:hypothetical protein
MDQEAANLPVIVIPAKAGIHPAASPCSTMDPGFRRDDECTGSESGRTGRMAPA